MCQPGHPAALVDDSAHLNNRKIESQVSRTLQRRNIHQNYLHTDGATAVPSVGNSNPLDNTGKHNEFLCNNMLLIANPIPTDVPVQDGPATINGEARLPNQDNTGTSPGAGTGEEDDIWTTPSPTSDTVVSDDQDRASPPKTDRPADQNNLLSSTPPSTTTAGPCSYSEGGVCHLHGQAQKKFKPGRRWTKGKNGLFSWRYCKTWYFVCSGPKRTTTEDGHQPTQKPTFLILKDSGTNGASGINKKTSKGNTMKTKPNKVTAATGSSKKS